MVKLTRYIPTYQFANNKYISTSKFGNIIHSKNDLEAAGDSGFGNFHRFAFTIYIHCANLGIRIL